MSAEKLPKAKAKKRGVWHDVAPSTAPLPILLNCDDSERCVSVAEYDKAVGRVTVWSSSEYEPLYNMGYFGTYIYDTRYRKKLERLRNAASKGSVAAVGSSDVQFSTSSEGATKPEQSLPEDEQSPKQGSADEKRNGLTLTFEETFFLSFALGCLIVTDKQTGRPYSIGELWCEFCGGGGGGGGDIEFVSRYVCYQYYRSKLWVVRSGVRYGADYVLYARGMPHYHATYAVNVVAAREGSDGTVTEVGGTTARHVTTVNCHNRVVESVAKRLILAYVIIPGDITDTALLRDEPGCVKKCKVKEIMINRWDCKQKEGHNE